MTYENSVRNRVPADAFAPGEFIQEELEERGWSQTELAEILGRPPAAVNQIIKGKRSITLSTAKELAAAFGTSPMLWLSLDAVYQLHKSGEVPPRIAIEARLRSKYPVRDMIQRGWVEHSDDPAILEARILSHFEIGSLDEEPSLPFAARKSETTDELSGVQLAWLFRVKKIAQTVQLPAYSERKLREALPRLQALTGAVEEIRHVPRILEECGVRFVIVEFLPRSKIDGVCFWLERDRQPVIAMTLRYDRIDNFWFVLRHEIEHVLRRDGMSIDSDIQKMEDSELPEHERRANRVAADFCVPSSALSDFVARVKPLFSEHRVLAFAHSLGVHPGIVVGQLQRRLGRWNLLRRHLEDVREIVTPNAVTDGYGTPYPLQ